MGATGLDIRPMAICPAPARGQAPGPRDDETGGPRHDPRNRLPPARADVPLLGGKLGRLEEIRLRWLWLAALAFALQVLIVTVVPEGDTGVHRAAHLMSYAGRRLHPPQPAAGGLPMDDRARRPPQPDGDRGQRSRNAGVAQRARGRPGSTRARARSRTRTSWRTRGSRSWATCSRSPRAGPARTCSRWATLHDARRAAGPPRGHRLAARQALQAIGTCSARSSAIEPAVLAEKR